MAHVIALVEDLFFVVRIQDAAKRAGCSIEFVREIPSGATAALAVIDLNVASSLSAIAAACATGIPVLAFVPHVNVELKRQALEAGADQVVARSNFAQHLDAALHKLASR